jgi:hypothetical protein
MRDRPGQRISWALAATTSLWVVLLTLAGAEGAVLYLAPALLMAVPLLWGRYPAERALARLASRRRRRPQASVQPSTRPRFARRLPVRGSLLLAHSLAGRAPPRPRGVPWT